jgi:hypothetical protein
LGALAERAGAAQQRAAVAQKLFALARQHQAAPHTIEELETELLLEVAELPGERRLSRVQPRRRPGDRAQLRHGDEGTRMPQIHGCPYAGSALMARHYMYWTWVSCSTYLVLVNARAALGVPDCR